MKIKTPFKTAFSLIEMSIVILVIGLLIAGVTGSSRLVKKAKLTTARTLTEGAPVNSIDDLVMWFETTSNRSFLTPEVADGTIIDTWFDIRNSLGAKIAAVQEEDAAYNPIYTKGAINNLPALKFTKAGGQYLLFDGSVLVGTDYTLFVVDQRSVNGTGDDYMIGGDSVLANKIIGLGYRTGGTIVYSGHGGTHDINYSLAATNSSAKARIFTATLSVDDGKTLYINGRQVAVDTTQDQRLVQYIAGYIGRYGANIDYQYDGYIGEVIFFARNLDTKERQAVENYLSKKWNVALNANYT